MFIPLFFCSLVLAAGTVEARHSGSNEPTTGRATNLRQKQMLNDLGFIRNLFEVTYAPLEWKEQRTGWRLDDTIDTISSVIMRYPDLTTKDFQSLVKDLCNRVGDYHVVAQFYSTQWAMLPFSIQSAEGKYYVSNVDYAEFGDLPFDIGDEIVSFGGKPIAAAVEEFRNQEVSKSYSETDRALSELYFTTRLGALGQEVPEGDVQIGYRKKNASKTSLCTLEWFSYPELISTAYIPPTVRAFHLPKKAKATESNYFKKAFATPHYKALAKVRKISSEPSELLGAKKSMLPHLGKAVWEAPEENEFDAYIFTMPSGKRGGYVRIATYMTFADEAVVDFAQLIQRFNQETDVLVIDQTSNPGGSVLYLYALLSMLTDKPLQVPQHRVKITQSDVYLAASELPLLSVIDNDEDAQYIIGDRLEGLTVDCDFAKGLFHTFAFILDQWDAGHLFTDFHYLYGIEKIKPHSSIRYTKPLLVLVNPLDFSAGDFFPAILQDNHRALLMGTRTAGAGGYIEQVEFPNLNGIEEIDFTASFSERPGRRPIENMGVEPDVVYAITPADLQNHYSGYRRKILEEMEKLAR